MAGNPKVCKEHAEFYEDMVHSLVDALEELGVEKEKAEAVSWAAAEKVRVDYGGQLVYVPKGTHLEVAKRSQRIFDRWNKGEEVDALAKEFDLSVPGVYRIVRRVLDQRKKATPGLFGSMSFDRELTEGA